MWPFKKDPYVRAKRDARVRSVQTGEVILDERLGGGHHTKIYSNLRCTFVQPGETIRAGQVIGKKGKR